MSGCKLHIGGKVHVDGWTILDVLPGDHVDLLGTAEDMTSVPDETCEVVYASHVLEHIPYSRIPKALREMRRVLVPGGKLLLSVPDFQFICRAFQWSLPYDKMWWLMRVAFGGQTDVADYHHTGLWWDAMRRLLTDARFREVKRVTHLGVFNDSSEMVFGGEMISLNVTSVK